MSFISTIKKDRLLQKTILAVTILAVCHWIQWERSGMNQALIRAVCATFYVLAVAFTGRRFWSYLIFAWAMAIIYYNRFCNYTSFIMVLIAAGFNPRTEKPFIAAYLAGFIACLYLYHDSWTHFVIHFLGCYFFYMIYTYINSRFRRTARKLDITPQEQQILKALAGGKYQKEIPGMNKNTVKNHLDKAKARNACSTTGELLALYKENMQ